jgi:myosin V
VFLERLLQSKDLKTHKHFQAPKQRNGTFIVHHYADSVTYSVEEFCEKNKDLLVSDVVSMMQVVTRLIASKTLCSLVWRKGMTPSVLMNSRHC